MGNDNQPKFRQAKVLQRKKPTRPNYDRILIVCEGEKTEPLYFDEIRIQYRLPTANVQVLPSAFGTQPIQVVNYANKIFRYGDAAKNIQPRQFERVYAVFDRDNHVSYRQALEKAAKLSNQRNDLQNRIVFQAIVSVPCFELWLLLHFVNVLAPMCRNDVYQKLITHLLNYDKGQPGYWEVTKPHLEKAVNRAERLAEQHDAYGGVEPYTDVYSVVKLLISLKAH